LAIALAKYYKTVIISADSRQFYKEMNIGTAKPDESQLRTIQHYFINHKSITELYGAGHFEKDALKLINELFEEKDLVILAGGSGLYINALLHGVDEFGEIPDSVRQGLNYEYETKGLEWLQEELKKNDEEYFRSADINNPQRLIRALEVTRHTGIPFSKYLKRHKTSRNFHPINILLNIDRKELYDRINVRVDKMMNEGLLNEVKELRAFRQHNALKTVGYQELFDHLDGKMTLEESITKIKQHTRNYAKRQLTWFRNKGTFKEFRPDQTEEIINYVDAIIKNAI
jgi:tRNA dimethylallyltransferase